MTETNGGKAIVETMLGRALGPGESLDVLSMRLREKGAAEAVDRLEAKLLKIEQELAREFPSLQIAKLTVEQRATLRILAHQELDGLRFVGQEPVAGFGTQRRVFVDAVSNAGLAPRLRFAHGSAPIRNADDLIQFGFESEYTMADLEGLLSVYGPAPEFGLTAEAWFAMGPQARGEWVKANLDLLFPQTRAMGGLVKLSTDPSLEFLPERLLRDATGNLEIVMRPVNTFEEWKRRVFLINEKFGAGSMQGTLSVSTEAFHGRGLPARTDENLGFFNFHNDLDSLEKLELGAARYARDPSKPAANSFNHPFLGPMTRLKQEHLVRYVTANSRGGLMDAESLKFVAYRDSSFKYTGGTAYRPDIVPGKRVVLEARDAHNNIDVLLDRMSRALIYLENGRGAFAGAAKLKAFDSRADFEKLPAVARDALRKLFQPKLEAGVAYADEERLALEVFRNFAYPMRDWSAQLRFLERLDLRNAVRLAQRNYSGKVTAVALELETGAISAKDASLRIQGALAEFAVESGLAQAYRGRATELLRSTVSGGAPRLDLAR